jgi:hypothetical protein
MSDENDPPTDGLNEMMRHWFEMASQTAEACQKWSAKPASPEAMRQTRADVFKVWGDYWEHILRSSSFLDAEKQCMDRGIESRKKIHEFLAQMHHELQLATAPDIDQLTRTLRRMREDQQEQSDQICAQLSTIAAQMDAIAERLNALENSAPPASASNPAPRIPPKPNPKNRKRRT